MHIESLSCKLKLLGKLIVQHDIRAWFDGRSNARAVSLQFAFPHLSCYP